MIQDAESAIAHSAHELQSLQNLRNSGFANIRSFINEIANVIDRAESTGRIQVPTSAYTIMNKHDSVVPQHQHQLHQQPQQPQQQQQYHTPAVSVSDSEAKRQEVSETLAMLGIDPSLLNVNAEIN